MRLTYALALLAAMPLAAAQAQTHRAAQMQQNDPTLYGPNAGRGDQTGMEAISNPGPLLRAARDRLAQGRHWDAQVLLEQAETRALTRSEVATRADRPEMGGVVGHITAARGAVIRRDRAGAEQQISQALAMLGNRGGMALAPMDMDTGASAGPGAASSAPMPPPGMAPGMTPEMAPGMAPAPSFPPQASPTWQDYAPQSGR